MKELEKLTLEELSEKLWVATRLFKPLFFVSETLSKYLIDDLKEKATFIVKPDIYMVGGESGVCVYEITDLEMKRNFLKWIYKKEQENGNKQ